MFLDSSVWERRWQALEGTMQAIERTLPSDTPRRQTVQRLLEGLQALASDQFQYFLTTPPPMPYSHDYALSLTLQQASHDLDALERAAHQRIAGAPKMRETLERADELAYQALRPAIGKFLPETTALSYFQKSPAAAHVATRALPYAPVALIGIPYTSVRFGRDYLALPHEAGHYLFWRGVVPNGEAEGLHIYNAIRKRLRARAPYHSETSRRWVEEIFADVYGCLIAGPVLALDFQDLQLQHSPATWTHDDGRHPPPALRPTIYLRALEKMGLAEWAASLRQRWQRMLAKAAALVNLPLAEAGLCSRQAELNTVVDVVYELLADEIDYDSTQGWPVLPRDEAYSAPSLYPSNQLEALYDDFESRVNALPLTGQEPDYLKPGGGEATIRNLREQFVAEERRMQDAPHIAEADWMAVLRAEGWINTSQFENSGG